MPIDQIDRQLLALLEGDARLSFASLGEAVGLSKTPCWKRVQALEAAGAIRGYHATVDPGALDLGTAAFVRISVRFDMHQAFEDAVRAHPMIVNCHATVGDTDYLAHILARDMADLDIFLRNDLWRLPGVERFTTTIAMREIKTGGSITANAGRKA
ncbi:AsnC family transcriptional regulator [Sphingomonas sp. Root710]|uniref:Lrp/AsnC family transcriptional regulator n=1 Tax=Sphingomonas sp. Root710 TaxID=1736594 RepID=UPI0006FAA462|nr:Lrp/AsnC family transcriptional regulator [Sphingomonas sp. Root710]KRB86298.1 AsnC family transcriptional regulator [Sphingomonas sp. Root710]